MFFLKFYWLFQNGWTKNHLARFYVCVKNKKNMSQNKIFFFPYIFVMLQRVVTRCDNNVFFFSKCYVICLIWHVETKFKHIKRIYILFCDFFIKSVSLKMQVQTTFFLCVFWFQKKTFNFYFLNLLKMICFLNIYIKLVSMRHILKIDIFKNIKKTIFLSCNNNTFMQKNKKQNFLF